MENDYLKAIASEVLPAQILDYFIVVGVEQTKTEIHISLDECNNKDLSEDIHFESKGFCTYFGRLRMLRFKQHYWAVLKGV